MKTESPIILGLSGGIACGKSTATSIFKNLGVSVLSTDELIASIYNENDAVRTALVDRYGETVLSPNMEINRRAIGAQVMQDEGELEWLEALLHPLVREQWQDWLKVDESMWKIVEIPLLFEKSLEKSFDLTLAVIASRQQQIERLSKRGLSHEVSQWWIDRQMPNEQKAAAADFVIFNDGSLEFLSNQVDRLFSQVFRRDSN